METKTYWHITSCRENFIKLKDTGGIPLRQSLHHKSKEIHKSLSDPTTENPKDTYPSDLDKDIFDK